MPRPNATALRLTLLAAATLLAGRAGAATVPWHIAEEATLYDGTARIVDATVAFAGGDAPSVALMVMTNADFGLRVAIRGDGRAWSVLPAPNGILFSDGGRVSVAVPPLNAAKRAAWDVAVLGQGGFEDPKALPLPAIGARPALPYGERPRAVVMDANGDYSLATLVGDRWRERRIASPNGFPPTVHVAPNGDAWVFVIDADNRLRVSRPGARATLTLAGVANFETGFDRKGRPVVAALQSSGRELTLVDGRRRRGGLTLPKDVTVADEKRCLTAPCRVVTHSATLDAALPLGDDGVAVLYTRVTTEAQRTCEPFTGFMHPCDPAGPVNTCPKRPEYTCRDAAVARLDPRVAWLAGGRVKDASLARLLGWDADAEVARDTVGERGQRVLGAAADTAGDLHLVVVETSGRASRVRWLRLTRDDDAPTPPLVGSVTPWDSALDVVPQRDIELGFAGLRRLDDVGELRAVADGGETGGEGLGVLWGADLDGLDAKRAAVVTAELTLTEGELCGYPGIELFHGDRGAAIYLTPKGLSLVDRFKLTKTEIPVSLVGRHRVALQVGASGARAFVDGAQVGEMSLSSSVGPNANEHARVGHTNRCSAPGAPIIWHRIAIGAGAVAP